MARKNIRALFFVLLAVLTTTGCKAEREEEMLSAPLPQVEVVTLEAEPLSLYSDLPGRLESVRVAEVRARVAGIVVRKQFEEGAEVKAGDVLFQIDPAPMQAAVSRAEAQLARAEAVLLDARALVTRYEPLARSEAVSRQAYDSARAVAQSAEADKQLAQADLETARLNLDYASVKAPIDGRIGRAIVTEGALVGQGETTLMARIQQLDPIYVDFTQPVADALRLREALSQGRLSESGNNVLTLQVEGTDQKRTGKLLFSDVSVERSTGQLSMRGEFSNPDALLLPGMYVRIRTPQGQDDQAILVPQRAVQRDGVGAAQVWVVDSNNKVEPRPVETGAMQGSRWHILNGLEAGEQVVVGGLDRVSSGAEVVAQPFREQQEESR